MAQQFGSGQILGLVGDCADANSLSERVSELEKAWGGLDGVVANVGDGRSVPDPVPDAEQWSQVWQTNFETALTTTRTCLPLLQASQGSLLFISSITGLSALGAPVDYSVAKTAVIALAQNLARKVAPKVRVNVIAPGISSLPEEVGMKSQSQSGSGGINATAKFLFSALGLLKKLRMQQSFCAHPGLLSSQGVSSVWMVGKSTVFYNFLI